MHGSRQKKQCPKCLSEINIPNFNRHLDACNGLGTFKENQKIKNSSNLINSCEYCKKEFSTIQGLNGHRYRSHILKDNQKEFGVKGNIKIKKLVDSGELILGKLHTEETKDLLSIIACERLEKHSKYSKNIEYKPGIILESSYEVRLAKILDELKIEWIKVRQGYKWDDNGKIRRYIPDFYLPKYNLFLDPKNDYLIKKDKKKIESASILNNIKVLVLCEKQIYQEIIKNLLENYGPVA